jgi:hypothetical protein
MSFGNDFLLRPRIFILFSDFPSPAQLQSADDESALQQRTKEIKMRHSAHP